MSLIEQFRKLHSLRAPLILGNVWDAHSAMIAEKNGFSALGTSSHAMANALGYEDGEEMPVAQLFNMVERIIKKTAIPVSVDFEAGYSQDPNEVADHVKTLSDLGVVGINLEDGFVENGKRKLGDANLLAEKIAAIKSKTKIFINARTDTYTTKDPNKLLESITRGQLYKTAGADCLFVPLIEKETEIKEFIQDVQLPLNVFITPALPKFDELKRLGVKRISHGGKLYEKLIEDLGGHFKSLSSKKDWSFLLEK